jgi:MATE family multidrug resistance protein
MNNVADLAVNTEVVFTIAAQLLLVAAIFQISDGIQVVVLGALRGLQMLKSMYITFVAYWVVGFPVSIYLGMYTDLEAAGNMDWTVAGLSTAAFIFYIFVSIF